MAGRFRYSHQRCEVMQIEEAMDVITADGETLGIIGHLLVPDGLEIRTGRQSHIIPTLWVLEVTDKVYILKSAVDARAGWV